MTNYTLTFNGTVDYIWYTTANLSVNSVLGEVDQSHFDKEYKLLSYALSSLLLDSTTIVVNFEEPGPPFLGSELTKFLTAIRLCA